MVLSWLRLSWLLVRLYRNHFFSRIQRRWVRITVKVPEASYTWMASSTSTTECKADHCHTPEEIVAVRSSLLAFVPTELADLILDAAKYWSKAIWSFKPKDRVVLDSKSNQGDNATFCCLLTPKLCDLLYSGRDGVIKMKAVCFKIASYDLHRAWRDENNYSGMI